MKYFLIIFTVLLSSCSSGAGLNLAGYSDASAHREDFIYCYGYGCSQKLRIGLNDSQWKSVEKIFTKKKVKSAEVERIKIAQAISLLETFTGQLAGIEKDLAKAPIIRQSFSELDCIDETINTTHYLRFMDQADLLQYHSVGRPAYKGGFVNGVYPHNTATIIEKKSGQTYVVDSYIFKNGEEPNIRSLDDWRRYRIEELSKAHNLSRL